LWAGLRSHRPGSGFQDLIRHGDPAALIGSLVADVSWNLSCGRRGDGKARRKGKDPGGATTTDRPLRVVVFSALDSGILGPRRAGLRASGWIGWCCS